ncbi:MAG: tRNA (adenosine(37)-N6)-threonylcarbamoyltransferase complex ATPase subunit type 1 TsaE [Pseudothermotoga sp.]
MKYNFGCLEKTEMSKLASIVAKELKPSQTVLLYGLLGSGKTTFVAEMAQDLGIEKGRVRSPSFSLINVYKGHSLVYHVDLYRLEGPDKEILMDLEEIIEGRDGILIVEWADRFEGFWSQDCLKIFFDFCENGRMIQMEAKDELLQKIVSRWLNGKKV